MVPKRDNFGKETNELIAVEGECKFIGENEFLDIPLQVTINRMPLRIKHLSEVVLVSQKISTSD